MDSADIAIIGGGAGGLAAAIFAARRRTDCRVVVLDGARQLGAKILVAGGGRCNVTNAAVAPEDFRGGSRNVIRRVLRGFPVPETVEFFREIGVSLHEEEHGKLFPDTNSSRTVLDALLREAERRGVRILPGHRVSTVHAGDAGFRIETASGGLRAGRAVLATGGESLPKTGSDGAGYRIAQSLGHTLVPTVPALVPLVLEGSFHRPLSGVTHEAALTVRVDGRKPLRSRGSMLWTHFGVSGPLILDASGLWHRARLEGRSVTLHLSMLPGESFESLDQRLIALAGEQPRGAVHNAIATMLPARLAEAVAGALAMPASLRMAQLDREQRRRLVHGLLEWPLPVRDSRGYQYAEVTSGGIPLSEVDPGTLESRRCPGLYLAGEILDVDGRIGGFNFQWAWASGRVAGESAAAAEAVR